MEVKSLLQEHEKVEQNEANYQSLIRKQRDLKTSRFPHDPIGDEVDYYSLKGDLESFKTVFGKAYKRFHFRPANFLLSCFKYAICYGSRDIVLFLLHEAIKLEQSHTSSASASSLNRSNTGGTTLEEYFNCPSTEGVTVVGHINDQLNIYRVTVREDQRKILLECFVLCVRECCSYFRRALMEDLLSEFFGPRGFLLFATNNHQLVGDCLSRAISSGDFATTQWLMKNRPKSRYIHFDEALLMYVLRQNYLLIAKFILARGKMLDDREMLNEHSTSMYLCNAFDSFEKCGGSLGDTTAALLLNLRDHRNSSLLFFDSKQITDAMLRHWRALWSRWNWNQKRTDIDVKTFNYIFKDANIIDIWDAGNLDTCFFRMACSLADSTVLLHLIQIWKCKVREKHPYITNHAFLISPGFHYDSQQCAMWNDDDENGLGCTGASDEIMMMMMRDIQIITDATKDDWCHYYSFIPKNIRTNIMNITTESNTGLNNKNNKNKKDNNCYKHKPSALLLAHPTTRYHFQFFTQCVGQVCQGFAQELSCYVVPYFNCEQHEHNKPTMHNEDKKQFNTTHRLSNCVFFVPGATHYADFVTKWLHPVRKMAHLIGERILPCVDPQSLKLAHTACIRYALEFRRQHASKKESITACATCDLPVDLVRVVILYLFALEPVSNNQLEIEEEIVYATSLSPFLVEVEVEIAKWMKLGLELTLF